jgi:hypothetical protein
VHHVAPREQRLAQQDFRKDAANGPLQGEVEGGRGQATVVENTLE